MSFRTYYVPHTVLGSAERTVNKAGVVSSLQTVLSPRKQTTEKSINRKQENCRL